MAKRKWEHNGQLHREAKCSSFSCQAWRSSLSCQTEVVSKSWVLHTWGTASQHKHKVKRGTCTVTCLIGEWQGKQKAAGMVTLVFNPSIREEETGNLYSFKASLIYIQSSRTAQAT